MLLKISPCFIVSSTMFVLENTYFLFEEVGQNDVLSSRRKFVVHQRISFIEISKLESQSTILS